ncbi:hypothetical protein RhiJN_07975 [Ceratobasidium sp. AG-Ba]|nr:hypothetical protein RhiJN_07975 [Ceratobasidium sp. AG-Ba]
MSPSMFTQAAFASLTSQECMDGIEFFSNLWNVYHQKHNAELTDANSAAHSILDCYLIVGRDIEQNISNGVLYYYFTRRSSWALYDTVHNLYFMALKIAQHCPWMGIYFGKNAPFDFPDILDQIADKMCITLPTQPDRILEGCLYEAPYFSEAEVRTLDHRIQFYVLCTLQCLRLIGVAEKVPGMDRYSLVDFRDSPLFRAALQSDTFLAALSNDQYAEPDFPSAPDCEWANPECSQASPSSTIKPDVDMNLSQDQEPDEFTTWVAMSRDFPPIPLLEMKDLHAVATHCYHDNPSHFFAYMATEFQLRRPDVPDEVLQPLCFPDMLPVEFCSSVPESSGSPVFDPIKREFSPAGKSTAIQDIPFSEFLLAELPGDWPRGRLAPTPIFVSAYDNFSHPEHLIVENPPVEIRVDTVVRTEVSDSSSDTLVAQAEEEAEDFDPFKYQAWGDLPATGLPDVPSWPQPGNQGLVTTDFFDLPSEVAVNNPGLPPADSACNSSLDGIVDDLVDTSLESEDPVNPPNSPELPPLCIPFDDGSFGLHDDLQMLLTTCQRPGLVKVLGNLILAK